MGPAAPILISLEDFGVQEAARSPRRSARMVSGREIVTALIRPLKNERLDRLKLA
jgi:hypothetical protein